MSAAELQRELAAAISEVTSAVPHKVLRAQTAVLMEAYRGTGPLPPALLGTPGAAAAYAAYRLPATYAATRHALRQAAAACPPLAPVRLVDIGGGSGAALWAAAHTFPTLRSAVVLDRSAEALALGRRLAARGSAPVLRDVRWTRQQLTGSAVRPQVPEADVGVLAYVLAELDAPTARGLVTAVAAAVGTVVVVEPGTPAGHRKVLLAREQLLRAGCFVVAPCPHAEPCPLQAGPAWCHFSVRLERSGLHRQVKNASLGHEDEKFSYVVATRTAGVAAERVVSRPRVRGGAVEVQVCGRDGQVRQVRVLKRHPRAFRAARDLQWGDRWEPPQ